MSNFFKKKGLFQNRALPSAKEFESYLLNEIIEPWFPVCLDREYGGFLCDFDRTWRPNGPQEKLLEFQARQTWTAAEASLVYPNDKKLKEAALHGFRYLNDVMWDKDAGGWFHRTDRSGKPLEEATKHMHGFAYAIPTCVAVYVATGEKEALEAAFKGYEWLDKHAYDHEHGGYFGFLARDGKPIKEFGQNPMNSKFDTIDTPIGCKDSNVHTDLLETFVYLYSISPDEFLLERFSELIKIVTERLASENGEICNICKFDWSLARSDRKSPENFGYNMQGAHRLLTASQLLPEAGELVNDAQRFIDHALRFGWDTQNGGMFAGFFSDEKKTINKRKVFWVQMETLWSLIAISEYFPENSDYDQYRFGIWNYIKQYLTDGYHHGIYQSGTDTLSITKRLLLKTPINVTDTHVGKGNVWKDASHDGRSLLRIIHTLEKNDSEDWMIFPLHKLLEYRDTSDV